MNKREKLIQAFIDDIDDHDFLSGSRFNLDDDQILSVRVADDRANNPSRNKWLLKRTAALIDDLESVHVFELDKYGNIDTKSAFKISKPKKPVDSHWITVFCNHCNKNVQIPYEEYRDLLFYDKPIHCHKCGSKNIRLLSANDKNLRAEPTEKKR